MICPYSLTVPGGVQGQVLGLGQVFIDRGHEVRVLAPCDAPRPEPWVTTIGTSQLNPSNGSIAPIAPDMATQLRVMRTLRDETFDVVHLHEPLVPGPCATTLVMKPAPLVGTFHAAGDPSDYKSFAWVARPMGRRLDALVAVSDDARALAEPTLGGSWTVLYNGVDVARFGVGEPWPRPTDRRIVLFVGRHEERKGLAVLLQSLETLPSDVRIWVASDGPQTAELQARHRDDERIEWLGRIGDVEKAQRLRGADVFCAPSLHGESFGVVLLEAMAAATPIVATDLPGYSRVARPGREALLVEPGDPGALAIALRRVLTDADYAGQLAEAGACRADELSMDNLADRYLDIYQRLA